MKKTIKEGILIIDIDGSEMKTKEQLMIIMKEALSFPDYFGMNWDALDEAIKDLSWLEDTNAISANIMNSNKVLADTTEKDCNIFKQIMDSAVTYWKTADEGLEFSVEYK